MKKITIEISDDQHQKLLGHISTGAKVNFEEETFSGYSITLQVTEMMTWLEVDMVGTMDLGSVTFKIE